MSFKLGNKQSKAGLTLLEVMLTSGILLIAIVALLYTFVNCIFLNESNKEALTAANDAQYVLEQIKSLAFSQIESYTPPVFTNLEDENIPAPVVTVISSRVKRVTVNVSWTDKRRRARSFALTTQFVSQ